MGASKKLTIRRFVVYLFAVGLLVLAKPHPWLYPAGVVLLVLGEGLRIWACGHLRKNQDVITSGPFAHVKNPLYVGTFLIVTGLSLCASNPDHLSRVILYAGYPFFFVVFAVYYFPHKVRVEGDRLRRRFGERFDEYDRAVPNFFPRLTRYEKASDAPWEARLLVENSEIGTLIWTVVGALIILAKFKTPDFW